ncbi:MAG: hypothetical protein RSB86_04200 [Comamonas sp.]|uniref:hypothetical protein n=1 Tax=Comamonas sp. TaxID=34028 RepID=UPI002FC7D237
MRFLQATHRTQNPESGVISAGVGIPRHLVNSIASLEGQIEEFDEHALRLRPTEASLRSSFENFNEHRAELGKQIDLHLRREKLASRRAEIDVASTKSDRTSLPVGPESTVLFEFGETVKTVLTEWGFPDADKVQFDAKVNDIAVAGKVRDANGKGVRAVLHDRTASSRCNLLLPSWLRWACACHASAIAGGMKPASTLEARADDSCVCASSVPHTTNAAEASPIFFCP